MQVCELEAQFASCEPDFGLWFNGGGDIKTVCLHGYYDIQ